MADLLYCCERLQPELPKAEKDPVIFSDMRVLKNLLYLEKQYVPALNYFNTVQTDIKPFMRQVVGTWMLDVCEELDAEDQVFPLSVNLLDRFLACCHINKRHLQLAASVCILLASKIRQWQFVKPESLSYLADHSFTLEDIKAWELLILSKLQWNLTAVTPHDFIEHIIDRVGLDMEHSLIRQHATTLVGICCIDPSFLLVRPSIIAAACIASAVRGLRTPSSSTAVQTICDLLDGTSPELVEPILRQIDEAIDAESAAIIPSHCLTVSTPAKHSTLDSHPETPTDISDILF